MDDDVETDEEVMENALKTCLNDCWETMHKLALNSWRKIVNNCEIMRRCQHPEDFNRNGKFVGSQEDQGLHPSIRDLHFTGALQSERHLPLRQNPFGR